MASFIFCDPIVSCQLSFSSYFIDESFMLSQWDSQVREFIILAGEWLKGCIIETKVIGSLRRRTR